MNMFVPKFDVHQRTGAKLFLRATHNLDVLIFFKKVLSDVWPETHLVQGNIVSNRQSVWAGK